MTIQFSEPYQEFLLAVAVGYKDIVSIANTTSDPDRQAIEPSR